jgi:hypothetical protein
MDKKLYEAGNLQEAEILKSQLERAGFEVLVKGVHLSGSLGELPAGVETNPSIWTNEEDFEKAKRFLDELHSESSQNKSPWGCPKCGETVEGSFLTCWNCGYES